MGMPWLIGSSVESLPGGQRLFFIRSHVSVCSFTKLRHGHRQNKLVPYSTSFREGERWGCVVLAYLATAAPSRTSEQTSQISIAWLRYLCRPDKIYHATVCHVFRSAELTGWKTSRKAQGPYLHDVAKILATSSSWTPPRSERRN